MSTRFLFNDAFWDEVSRRIPKAKRVSAAVAYLGSGASSLLPLRKGDRLVVDMSLRSVRAGSTDPKEVQKLLKRGVVVFTRASLHAKFIVIDRIVLAGSANISKNARQILDEAALVTDDAAAVARAVATFERLCSEPVRKDYLKKCLTEYRPPRGHLPADRCKRTAGRIGAAKVWVIGGLRYLDLPEDEEAKATRLVGKAKRLLAFERTEVDFVHFPSRPRYFERLRVGEDWCVRCIRSEHGIDVYPPARAVKIESYPRGPRKRRYFLLLEVPNGGKVVPWRRVQMKIRTLVPGLDRAQPRTTPLRDDGEADAVLRLWDSRGRFRKS